MSALVQKMKDVITSGEYEDNHLTEEKLHIEKERGYQALSISDAEPNLYLRSFSKQQSVSYYEYDISSII